MRPVLMPGKFDAIPGSETLMFTILIAWLVIFDFQLRGMFVVVASASSHDLAPAAEIRFKSDTESS